MNVEEQVKYAKEYEDLILSIPRKKCLSCLNAGLLEGVFKGCLVKARVLRESENFRCPDFKLKEEDPTK